MALPRTAAAAACGGMLALAGCGGDDPPPPPAAETRSSPPPTVPPPATATTPTATTRAPAPPAARRPPALEVEQALGQMIVARYAGPAPSPQLLTRVRRGQVGGVILFADNVAGGTATVRRAVRALHGAARRGGVPRVLVMVDQEGGTVKRLPGPPATAAAGMTSAARARAEGRATGRLLRDLGIGVDLAPVADVPGPGSFLGSRAFGRSAGAVAARACAFAAGLREAGVGATLKHFPGLGSARVNTDDRPTTVTLAAEALRHDYAAYRRCGARPGTLVMVSSATYPTLIGPRPAVLSRRTYSGELRRATGAAPVTISDDLEAPAVTVQEAPARRAIAAGLDLLLYARTEAASAAAYDVLVRGVRAGEVDPGRVRRAARRILRLKATLARRR
jgi:beta-N-acetylhexosaminidase